MMLWFYSSCLLLVIYFSHNTFADEQRVPHRVVVRQASSYIQPCNTPDNKSGGCFAIKSCPSLYKLLLTNGRNRTSSEFLRKSQCGTLTEDGMPVVCCTDPISQTTTRRPVVTTQSVTERTKRTTKAPLVTTKATTQKATTTTTKATTSKKVNYGECGKTERSDSRIVGGKNATLGDWPWMVALGYTSANSKDLDFKCGATLISNKWVLTAAHCVKNIGNIKLTTARLGDLDLDPNVEDKATPVDAIISEIIPHSEYTTSPITNDIALLRLKNTVQFSKYIRPACLLTGSEYRSDDYYSRKRPFIIGWGAIEWRGATSTRLQETTISIVNQTLCAETYSTQRSAKIDERVLCAGEKGRDTCQGDSGGPLIFPGRDENGKNTYFLGGVVSFGVRCADLTYPGVYTRVAAFAEWISETTGLTIDD